MNNYEKIKVLGINALALWLEDNFIVQVPAEEIKQWLESEEE